MGTPAIPKGACAGETLMPAKTPAPPTPPDLAAALAERPEARERWERLPPSHRREHLRYVDEAKRPETRARRIAKTVEDLAAKA